MAPRAGEKERAFIEALAKRYALSAAEDRRPLDQAYADAMREVARELSDDVDAVTLFAEALLDLHPWDYWTKEGKPQPWTPEIVQALESVLKRAPDHQGAIHFYIYAVEASPAPQRAEPYADRLTRMVPGTSHLAHMPSHIYIRVGRYHDAVLANQRALQADNSYIAQCHAQGLYPLGYMPHNSHFLWYAAAMEGRSALAMRAARETAAQVDRSIIRRSGMGVVMQHFSLIPLYGLLRFGKWDDILNEPEPPEDLLYFTGVWRFARGMALTAKGRLEEAALELDKVKAIASNPLLQTQRIWDANTTASLLHIASEVLSGELAAKRGDYENAIGRLKMAVNIEDGLVYIEPPDWYYPVRQFLGAILLEAGRPDESERAYREDLRLNPENGWSLLGLAQSLRDQGKADEAREVEKRFQKAWARADVTLLRSRF